MRIQSNIAALNTSKNLAKAQKGSQSNIAKLSSGYAINKAADNASGLAISEKMRGQIRGLKQASKNATDGINLISTAEGYMSTANDILQRMRELAVQSANGTYDSANNTTSVSTGDRSKINEEIQQLTDELDRLGDTANFNGMKLNNQTFKFQVGADTGDAYGNGSATAHGAANLGNGNSGGALTVQGANNNVISVSIGGFDSKSLGVNAGVPDGVSVTDKRTAVSNATSALNTATTALTTAQDTIKKAADPNDSTTTSGTIRGALEKTLAKNLVTVGNNGATSNVTEQSLRALSADDFTTLAKGFAEGNDKVTIGNTTFRYAKTGDSPTSSTANATSGFLEDAVSTALTADKTFSDIQTDVDAYMNKLDDIFTKTNTVTEKQADLENAQAQVAMLPSETAGIDLTTQDKANKSIDIIDDAIADVTAYRARLGAAQNRLEYTVDNISTSVTNTTASESAIRETDMVTEMMEFTKNNVMSQAATAMMAQANSQTQSVLQLLQ